MKIATSQDYRIAALYRLGASQPLSPRFFERKLIDFAGLSPEKAKQLISHWFGTLPFKATREAR